MKVCEERKKGCREFRKIITIKLVVKGSLRTTAERRVSVRVDETREKKRSPGNQVPGDDNYKQKKAWEDCIKNI